MHLPFLPLFTMSGVAQPNRGDSGVTYSVLHPLLPPCIAHTQAPDLQVPLNFRTIQGTFPGINSMEVVRVYSDEYMPILPSVAIYSQQKLGFTNAV